MSTAQKASKVLSGTSGAVPMRNEKGEIYMQKVKVDRYVAGKRPKYAPDSDEENEQLHRGKSDDERDEESSEDEVRAGPSTSSRVANLPLKTDVNDRRLKRLNQVDRSVDVSEEARRRHVAEPEIIKEADDMEIESEDEEGSESEGAAAAARRRGGGGAESDEEEVDEEERIRRRAELRKRALQRQEELMAREEENKAAAGARRGGSDEESDEEEDESEYEDDEYSDEEDDSAAPRLKPVFIRKDARVTIQEKEKEKEREKQLELERERLHQENKKHTRKIIQDEIAREKQAERETDDKITCDFKTDDEDNEKEYEEWKLRELKRIKRDREEKENEEKDKQEIQKIRNMTEEERNEYFKQNPKLVTNQNVKGKYKFLQKYYHRGAFYMDEDEKVFNRDFAQPTLEDRFDKTILPKVMQVKNFGMAGRTKYTHLMDQDTSAKQLEENPWSGQEKFISGKGGGTKQVFDKPTAKKRK